MRTIKFRAWDVEKMTVDFLVYSDGEVLKDEGSTDDGGIACSRQITWKLMQFTGLSDKNGKEIYEGDVVEEQGRRYSVSIPGVYQTNYGDGLYEHEAEVIGNIYENPDLV